MLWENRFRSKTRLLFRMIFIGYPNLQRKAIKRKIDLYFSNFFIYSLFIVHALQHSVSLGSSTSRLSICIFFFLIAT